MGGGEAESYTQAEIVRLLQSLDRSMTELREDVKRLEQNYVTRAEWALWKEGNDREMKQQQAALADVRTATAPVKVSGWMIAGFGVSAVVGARSLIALVITLIQVVPK